MRSGRRGQHTSDVEVTNVSHHGMWVLLGERELFLSFEMFPWFRDAPVAKLLRLELPSPGHLYWPDLDIDLAQLPHPAPRQRCFSGARAAQPPEMSWGDFGDLQSSHESEGPGCRRHRRRARRA